MKTKFYKTKQWRAWITILMAFFAFGTANAAIIFPDGTNASTYGGTRNVIVDGKSLYTGSGWRKNYNEVAAANGDIAYVTPTNPASAVSPTNTMTMGIAADHQASSYNRVVMKVRLHSGATTSDLSDMKFGFHQEPEGNNSKIYTTYITEGAIKTYWQWIVINVSSSDQGNYQRFSVINGYNKIDIAEMYVCINTSTSPDYSAINAALAPSCTAPSVFNITGSADTYVQNSTAAALTVPDGTATSYQWYERTTAGNTGGIAVTTGTGYNTEIFTPSTANVGTKYYYCVAYNDENQTINECIRASSNSIAITVTCATGGSLNTFFDLSTTAPAVGLCSGSTTTITLDGSQENVSYQLLKGGVADGAAVAGTGSVLTWTGKGSGVYTIRATGNSTDFCSATAILPTTLTIAARTETGSSIIFDDLALKNASTGEITSISPTGTQVYIGVRATNVGCGDLTSIGKYGVVFDKINDSDIFIWHDNSEGNDGPLAAGASVWLWTTGGNNTTALGTYANGLWTPTVGTYSIKGRSDGDAKDWPGSNVISITKTVTITSCAAPTISANPLTTPQDLCFNQEGTPLSVTATGSNLKYQWYSSDDNSNSTSDDDKTVGTDSNTFTPPAATTASKKYYYCVVSNTACGASTKSTVSGKVVTIDCPATCDAPTISNPVPASICGGGEVTLGATISAGSINWYNASTGGSLVHTGNSYTLTVSSTTDFWLEGVDGDCTTPTRTKITATVNTIPTVDDISSVSACLDGTVSVNFSGTGDPSKFTWNRTDGNIGGTASGEGNISFTANVAGTATYSVIPSTALCTGDAKSFTITAYAAPEAPAAPTASSICEGSNLKDLAPDNSSGNTWYWQTTVNGTDETSNVTADLNAVAGNIYYLSAKNATGCWSNTTTGVTVSSVSAPVVEATSCRGNLNGLIDSSENLNDLYWQTTSADGTSTDYPATKDFVRSDSSNDGSGTTYWLRRNDGACWGTASAVKVINSYEDYSHLCETGTFLSINTPTGKYIADTERGNLVVVETLTDNCKWKEVSVGGGLYTYQNYGTKRYLYYDGTALTGGGDWFSTPAKSTATAPSATVENGYKWGKINKGSIVLAQNTAGNAESLITGANGTKYLSSGGGGWATDVPVIGLNYSDGANSSNSNTRLASMPDVTGGTNQICLPGDPIIVTCPKPEMEVEKIIWSNTCDKDEEWSNPNNWILADGTSLDEYDYTLSSDLHVVIPAPDKIKDGIYPSMTNYNLGDIKTPGDEKYIHQLEIENGAEMLIKPLAGKIGDSHKCTAVKVHLKVNNRTDWILVGANLSGLVSGNFYKNLEPVTYINECIIEPYGNAQSVTWSAPIGGTATPLVQNRAFALRVPNQYGSTKRTSYYYYNKAEGSAAIGQAPIDFTFSGNFYETMQCNYTKGSGFVFFNNTLASSISVKQLISYINTLTGGDNTTIALWETKTENGIEKYDGFISYRSWGDPSATNVFIAPMTPFAIKIDNITSDFTLDLAAAEAEISAINYSSGSQAKSMQASPILSVVVNKGGDTKTKTSIIYTEEPLADISKLFFTGNTAPEIFINANDQKLQGKVINDLSKTVDLGIKTTSAEIVTLAFTGVESFDGIAKVYLTDKETGITQQLSEGYEIDAELLVGFNADRFVISFETAGEIIDPINPSNPGELTTDDIISSVDSGVKIYSEDNKNIVVSTNTNDEISNITVMNMAGATVRTIAGAHSYTVVDMSGNTAGLYIVKVTTNKEIKTAKIVIK